MTRETAEPIIDITSAIRVTLVGVLANLLLAVIKIVTGLLGNTYALVADGIESLSDGFTSIVVLVGLRVSVLPPDEKHPYGHGRAESLAGLFVSAALFLAAGSIIFQSLREIRNPQNPPEWFTLPVLVAVIVAKILMWRVISATGREHGSSALKGDAWHHASDAITSVAAFIGISVALIGGDGWESADDWAALFACGIIIFSGIKLLRGNLDEIMDAAVPTPIEQSVRGVASAVRGVAAIEKCRIRKSGIGLIMDIHVEVDGELSVTAGHEIAGAVKAALLNSRHNVVDVTVHIEPASDPENAP